MFSRAIRWSKAYWWIYVILKLFSAVLFHSCWNLTHFDETNDCYSFIGGICRKISQFYSYFYKQDNFSAGNSQIVILIFCAFFHKRVIAWVWILMRNGLPCHKTNTTSSEKLKVSYNSGIQSMFELSFHHFIQNDQ